MIGSVEPAAWLWLAFLHLYIPDPAVDRTDMVEFCHILSFVVCNLCSLESGGLAQLDPAVDQSESPCCRFWPESPPFSLAIVR